VGFVEPLEVPARKPVNVRVPCVGLDAGSSVTVKVYEIHELGGDPIETLQASVDDSASLASVQWTYDPDRYKSTVDSSCFVFVVEGGGRTSVSRPCQFLDLFETTVTDSNGTPAAHRAVVLCADRGKNVETVTDDRGRIRIAVPPGKYHVELRGPVPPETGSPDVPETPPAGTPPVETAAPEPAIPSDPVSDSPAPPAPAASDSPTPEVADSSEPAKAPEHGCALARLSGIHFDMDKTFLLPSAIPYVQALARYQAKHQGDQLLICGHTDTVGPASYNLLLSNERATMVGAYLTKDADAWEKRFTTAQVAGQVWGTFEVEFMLSVLPEGDGPKFYDGTPDGNSYGAKHSDAVLAFQKSVGLSATGDDSTPGTKRKLIEAYQAIQGTALTQGTAVEVVACNGYHPIDHPGVDQYDSEINRRVELFIWDQGQTIEPPPDACRKSPHPGCTAYDAWVQAVHHEIDSSETAPGPSIAITLEDDAGEPLPGVALLFGATTVTTNSSGNAQFPPGSPSDRIQLADDSLAAVLAGRSFDRPFASPESGTWVTAKQLKEGIDPSGLSTLLVITRHTIALFSNTGRAPEIRVQKAGGEVLTGPSVSVSGSGVTVSAHAVGDGTKLEVVAKERDSGLEHVVAELDLDAIAAGGDFAVSWDVPSAPSEATS
jgi:hypothetical protein